MQLALNLGLSYREGFVKNRYIGRTFIMPGQASARNRCARNSTPWRWNSRARTCCWWTIPSCAAPPATKSSMMAREAGAKQRVTSPRPRRRCAIPTSTASTCPRQELIANGRSEQKIQTELGCDWLIYQDLPDLIDAVQKGNPDVMRFDTSCFNNEYVTGDINQDYLDLLGRKCARTKPRRHQMIQHAVGVAYCWLGFLAHTLAREPEK